MLLAQNRIVSGPLGNLNQLRGGPTFSFAPGPLKQVDPALINTNKAQKMIPVVKLKDKMENGVI